jgi:hypothetical protein
VILFTQRRKHMQKVSRHPFSRAIAAMFHHRYLRRNTFKINTKTLERLEADVAAQRALRSSDPKAFASSSFYGPFSRYN